MENSYKFFANTSCKYYPCHDMPNNESLNCLFCFCPLFHLKDCGGNYKILNYDNLQIKDCSNCYKPHLPKSYDDIVSKLSSAI